MGTVPRVMVWKTVSPTYTDFGGLSSGVAPVVVRLDVVSFQPRCSVLMMIVLLLFLQKQNLMVLDCWLGGYPVDY
jgi:hypothetical protein